MHRGSGRSTYDGKIAGLYDLEETLGRGHFAVVKSARHVFTGEKVAVKVIDKSKLDEVSRAHLFQEVRCMKLVQHPNVVRLYEVIDTQTKLYLILELGDGGDLYDYIMRHEAGLGEETARGYFRQIVRAISYCHRLRVAHRDLKPENVVFFERLGMVKLTDFGFSNRFDPGQKLETSCGSLAYSAPEILLGDSYDAPAVDVWSLGVILYMLVCGQAPFQEANDSETLTMIMDCKYTMPGHVSEACKRLIGRMLVREPERRATLMQIASDPWLGTDQNTEPADFLPLISREHVSDEDHAFIIQRMVTGNIASKEEILEALDKNEYNHITATYFLLAERKLRAHRQEQAQTQQRLRASASASAQPSVRVAAAEPLSPAGAVVPDAQGRVRKCSIVQEEEDEDDMGGGREELAAPHCSLNRRGSRSEGKLNLAVQERLAESERRKEATPGVQNALAPLPQVGVRDDGAGLKTAVTPVWIPPGKRIAVGPKQRPALSKLNSVPGTWRMGANKQVVATPTARSPRPNTTTTSIITESSTISIPVKPSASLPEAAMSPKYKTMPSPTRPHPPPAAATPQLALVEIFEDEETSGFAGRRRDVGRQQQQARSTTAGGYEQRRTKFHKARTASCSSSDASDDDSEGRKKRAHKLSGEGKPLSQRRDSHDDSSDSQDPSGSGGGAGGGGGGGGTKTGGTECGPTTSHTADVSDNTQQTSGGGGGGRRQQCSGGAGQAPFGRRHRAGRRRAGETRLRESQSLNRITEVQEAEQAASPSPCPHAVSMATTAAPETTQTQPPKTSRSFGARLLQGWSLTSKKSAVLEDNNSDGGDSASKDTKPSTEPPSKPTATPNCCTGDGKENCKAPKPEKQKGGKKVRLLGRYFQVHKKLCLPLPGLFGRGRLYKAQSCGAIVRDRVNPPTTASVVLCGEDRWCTVAGNDTGSADKNVVGDGDVNQNLGMVRSTPRLDTIVPLVATCPGISICSFHLGDGSKCCHLC